MPDGEEAALGNPARRGPPSRRRLFMHLDRNSIAESRQGGFETGQSAGGTRVDQTRRLAVVDVEAAG